MQVLVPKALFSLDHHATSTHISSALKRTRVDLIDALDAQCSSDERRLDSTKSIQRSVQLALDDAGDVVVCFPMADKEHPQQTL